MSCPPVKMFSPHILCGESLRGRARPPVHQPPAAPVKSRRLNDSQCGLANVPRVHSWRRALPQFLSFWFHYNASVLIKGIFDAIFIVKIPYFPYTKYTDFRAFCSKCTKRASDVCQVCQNVWFPFFPFLCPGRTPAYLCTLALVFSYYNGYNI